MTETGEDMDDLKVGDRIKDNDPRVGDRILTVSEVTPGHRVAARDAIGRVARIARERIFTDNKERKYGFNKLYYLR